MADQSGLFAAAFDKAIRGDGKHTVAQVHLTPFSAHPSGRSRNSPADSVVTACPKDAQLRSPSGMTT